MNGGDILELSVAEFARGFKTWIERQERLRGIALIGEVSDCNRGPTGHLYVTLKDGEAALKCFSYESEARAFPDVRKGIKVRAEGSIEIFQSGSIYQLHAIKMSLVGAGDIAAQIEALRATLRLEGALEASRRRAIPDFPRRVALITADGDARIDFERRLTKSAPHVRVTFIPTRVQGKGAEIDIAEAMDRAARQRVDVVVLTRGGGSSDDRLTFDLEPVIRAILRSPHPVITALGHTSNKHLADEVADLALEVPLAAADRLAENWVRSFEKVKRSSEALDRNLRSLVREKTQRADSTNQSLQYGGERALGRFDTRLRQTVSLFERRNPVARVKEQHGLLSTASTKLRAWADRAVDSRLTAVESRNGRLREGQGRWRNVWSLRLERVDGLLTQFSPEAPLERGYAIVSKDGRALRDVSSVSPGDLIAARLARGTLDALVERVRNDE